MSQEPTKSDLESIIREALRLVNYGEIVFIVHDGEVVRVDTKARQILSEVKQ